eukprot:TRINITY_DN2125_c0_g1_i1.p1 TRINITY_DN2125_c0_g1~~TRINITY_DN2125_c0_g1_i1.p1  ORF type:complete len:272 (+),score=72.96 TRINITY_DN2125_c0_g1_i1:83-817(+)
MSFTLVVSGFAAWGVLTLLEENLDKRRDVSSDKVALFRLGLLLLRLLTMLSQLFSYNMWFFLVTLGFYPGAATFNEAASATSDEAVGYLVALLICRIPGSFLCKLVTEFLAEGNANFLVKRVKSLPPPTLNPQAFYFVFQGLLTVWTLFFGRWYRYHLVMLESISIAIEAVEFGIKKAQIKGFRTAYTLVIRFVYLLQLAYYSGFSFFTLVVLVATVSDALALKAAMDKGKSIKAKVGDAVKAL